MSKLEKAKAFISAAKATGHVISVEGEWIKYSPPLPANLLIEASKLANEIKIVLTTPTNTR